MIVLCTPTALPSGVPGAVAGVCLFCSRSIWISPSTRKLQQRSLLTQYELACIPCGSSRMLRDVRRNGPITEIAVAAEQHEEVLRLTGQTPEEILSVFGVRIVMI